MTILYGLIGLILILLTVFIVGFIVNWMMESKRPNVNRDFGFIMVVGVIICIVAGLALYVLHTMGTSVKDWVM